MYAVLYRWRLKSGHESSFETAWADRTEEIKKEHGALGSRLHRADDGSFIAYAQWPSRESWEEASSTAGANSPSSLTMKEATESFEIVARMEVIKDLLVEASKI